MDRCPVQRSAATTYETGAGRLESVEQYRMAEIQGGSSLWTLRDHRADSRARGLPRLVVVLEEDGSAGSLVSRQAPIPIRARIAATQTEVAGSRKKSSCQAAR